MLVCGAIIKKKIQLWLLVRTIGFQCREVLLCDSNGGAWNAGQSGNLQPITTACRAGGDLVQKNDMIFMLHGIQMHVADLFEFRRERG